MKTNNNSSNSSWTASKLTNQYVTLKNHIINYGYLYNGSEIKFGIILIHVIFNVMAITKTTANLINTNGILINPNPIKLKLNCMYSTLNIGINEKKPFSNSTSATNTNICYSYNELNLFQWYGPFNINSVDIKTQYATHKKS